MTYEQNFRYTYNFTSGLFPIHFITTLQEKDVLKRIDCLTIPEDQQISDEDCKIELCEMNNEASCSKDKRNKTASRNITAEEVEKFLCGNL